MTCLLNYAVNARWKCMWLRAFKLLVFQFSHPQDLLYSWSRLIGPNWSLIKYSIFLYSITHRLHHLAFLISIQIVTSLLAIPIIRDSFLSNRRPLEWHLVTLLNSVLPSQVWLNIFISPKVYLVALKRVSRITWTAT